MQNKILGEVSFAAQYAKPIEGGRESWVDAVNRVESMHQKKFKELNLEIEIRRAFDFVREKRVFASQRSTQFGGRAIERNNMRMFNCTFSSCDRLRFFAECFWLLLSGCGTGFSVRRQHVAKLPRLISEQHWRTRPVKRHCIVDSIEGWANAALMLIESYCIDSYYDLEHDKEIEFNYSLIRKKGSPISSGGRAPGYKPLKIALEKIRSRLRNMVARDQKFHSIDCFDLVMFLSEAVLSGGVRRSASIAIFDEDDQEMIESKKGDWWKDHPERAYANISAGIKLDGNEKQSTVNEIVDASKQWGEPGVAFFKSDEHGTNPCAEIGLLGLLVRDQYGDVVEHVTLDMLENKETYIKKGYSYFSGWQSCNLTEINMSKNKSAKEFFEACKVASFIGTLQAAYTRSGYLGHTTQRILERESLIGVSMTGMCENSLSFHPAVLRAGAHIINKENQRVAKILGINSASRTTCVKPSGNTSTIAGGISSGIHPHHAKKYIRRMRISKVNPIWEELMSKVPQACHDHDENTGIISFACQAPLGSVSRETSDAMTHLQRVKTVYKNWILPGSTQTRVEGLTHNVSNTCTVKKDEWSNVASFIWDHRESLRGVALLGYVADHLYDMAPYQTVIDGHDSEKTWNDLASIDWDGVNLFVEGEGENPVLDPACSGGECTLSF